MHRVRFFSAIALVVTATSALAQTPAAPQPDGHRLRLAADSLEVYVVRLGRPERTGFLIDRLDTVRVDGETMLRRIRRTTDAALGSGADTLVQSLATLQPRSVRSHSDRGVERLDWQTSRVVGVVEDPDSPARAIDSPHPAGWYSSASFDLILRALSARRRIWSRRSHFRTRGLARSDRDGRRFRGRRGSRGHVACRSRRRRPSGDVLDQQDLAPPRAPDHTPVARV